MPPYARPVNMMFQSYALFPHMSVADNVGYGLKREGVAQGARSPRASPRSLDAGAARRARPRASRTSSPAASASAWRWRAPWSSGPSCCCSTSRSPPSTASCARSTRFELVRLQEQLGLTFVVVTHDQEEAMAHGRAGSRVMNARPHRAGRHAARDLRTPGDALRRRLHRRRQHPADRAAPFALNAIGKAAGIELKRDNIQVLTVCPGYVRTDFGKNAVTGRETKRVRPEKVRGITAERVARATLQGYLKKKREVIVPWTMHLPIKLYQLFPRLVEWEMGAWRNRANT